MIHIELSLYYKQGVTSTTFEHCCSRSQVKLHRPALPPSTPPPDIQAAETMEDMEEEIYDYIRVLYPTQVNNINVPKFLEPEDGVVEDAVEDLESFNRERRRIEGALTTEKRQRKLEECIGVVRGDV